ncbi:hypothetical protein [Solemya velum gill symbiont]|uniref:hypothetical protein n=1 Tax=Solemya velum gill symbiont TaxID=2340 RepID=UPI0015C3E948|nr:hypothetical protein [Solemya velum gill symbiont]
MTQDMLLELFILIAKHPEQGISEDSLLVFTDEELYGTLIGLRRINDEEQD